jgi:PAS domain S-box-containing protein
LKKAILIGFFLAFVSRTCIALHWSHPDVTASSTTAFLGTKLPSLNGSMDGKQVQNNPTTQPSTQTPNGSYYVWWIVLAVILLMLPLYLLFLIRKRQVHVREIARLRADTALLFDRAPCGYHSIDERGYFININETLLRWLGYEKEEVIRKLRFSDFVGGEANEVEKQVAALLQGGASVKHMDLKRKNGEHISVVIKEITKGEEPHFSNRLFSTMDNSDCKEALERIKTLDNELESFSYSISHDLRAPLRSIDGYSKILQEDYAAQLDDEGKRVLNVIMNNAKRMGALIDDLLEFGRLGRKTIQHAHINMRGMVNAIVQDLRLEWPDRKIDIKVGELHTAYADADMMRQVWLNLLNNALKFTARQDVAVIQVTSFKTDRGEWCYQVEDNGVGFDMKYAPKLFGVFQRLHKIQDFGGTGVGLAIVKRIISRHGGRVWAKGSLENGAVFYFTIPIEHENT